MLPTTVVADPDRLARFEREARILAALSHPQIAQILHLETSGAVQKIRVVEHWGDELKAKFPTR